MKRIMMFMIRDQLIGLLDGVYDKLDRAALILRRLGNGGDRGATSFARLPTLEKASRFGWRALAKVRRLSSAPEKSRPNKTTHSRTAPISTPLESPPA